MPERIEIPRKGVYKYDVSIREAGGNSTSFEVTLPRTIVRRYAEDHDLSLEEATERLHVQVIANDFEPPGIFLKFVEKEESPI